jgi:hypothetical protein
LACKKEATQNAKEVREKQPLTSELIRELLDYDPETGVFRWRTRTSSKTKVGDIADKPCAHGYLRISIFYKKYLSHRLAWLYVHGEFHPLVEHKNRNPSDNRISNLRIGSSAENGWNRSFNKNNKLGLKGVVFTQNKWRARIDVNGRVIYLGYFQTPREAAAAYNDAAVRYHGEFACLNALDQAET